MKKPRKPKSVNYEIIPPMDGEHEPEPHKILREIRNKYHKDLNDAKIALAWRKNLKPDKDGIVMLGKCVKASDLSRALAPQADFVILLNRETWRDMDFTVPKKTALIDHELCHAAQVLNKFGHQSYDEEGRAIWRVRRHDIEEFREIVERHGCYKHDLEKFAEALRAKKDTPILPGMEKPKHQKQLDVN